VYLEMKQCWSFRSTHSISGRSRVKAQLPPITRLVHSRRALERSCWSNMNEAPDAPHTLKPSDELHSGPAHQNSSCKYLFTLETAISSRVFKSLRSQRLCCSGQQSPAEPAPFAMGVDVETLEKGDAQVLPSNGDRLTVNYCGWRLADGKEKGEFDSSYSPTGTTKGKR